MIEIMEHGNSGIKIFSYKGQKALQVVGVENGFTKLAKNIETPFARIIEIGTDYGGLTNLLADNEIAEVAEIHTFDILANRFVCHNDKITFHHKDVFKHEEEIADMISKDGRTLLLCDGGHKQREFEVFHKYLKSGDVIMAHDYAPNDQEFVNNFKHKIWSWHEFRDDYADFEGLEFYMQDVFKKYAWCIRRKK